MEEFFGSIISTDGLTVAQFFIIFFSAVATGIVFALLNFYKSKSSKNFFITIALIPAAVAMVIMLVNGNIGIGVAVAGAFGLVRFRSAQGNAKEICELFIAMASGLAFGVGYIAYAIMFTILAGLLLFLFNNIKLFEAKEDKSNKSMRITIPEDLDYTNVFDDLFARYTKKHDLISVKSTNMGSLFKLKYNITLIDPSLEKEFVDQLRCRNGNLEIMIERIDLQQQDL